jgi:hypothetical protein
MTSPEEGARRRRRLRFAFLACGPFVGVLIAAALGASPDRVRPSVAFLAVAAAAAAVALTTGRAKQRRAYRLKRSPVSKGVRFEKPWWLYADGFDLMVHYAALLGALFSIFHLAGVGVGILLVAFAVLGLSPFYGFGPRGLTFETAGLRLHYRKVEVLVPWSEIRNCEQVGPDHMGALQFRIANPERISDWVAIDTPVNRDRARAEVAQGGKVLWLGWTAGLDAQTLLRGIREGIEGRTEQAN